MTDLAANCTAIKLFLTQCWQQQWSWRFHELNDRTSNPLGFGANGVARCLDINAGFSSCKTAPLPLDGTCPGVVKSTYWDSNSLVWKQLPLLAQMYWPQKVTRTGILHCCKWCHTSYSLMFFLQYGHFKGANDLFNTMKEKRVPGELPRSTIRDSFG